MTGIDVVATLVTIVLVSCATVILVPCAFLLVEVIASTWPSPRRAELDASSALPPFAVLMPAHNEANSIAESLTGVQSQLRASRPTTAACSSAPPPSPTRITWW